MDDLYFVCCGDFVKIGRTVDLTKRLSNMQANTPHDLDCICRLPGRGREEKIWHEAFADLRERGEWFARTPSLDKAIALARQDKPWWGHIYPPFEHMERVGGDELGEAIVDWHIRVQLHCHENPPGAS